MATLAGCRALSYPHTTYLLDDGRREEMARAGGDGRGRVPDPPRQLAREGGQHQRGAAAHRGRAGPRSSTPTTCRCPTRSTRSSATSTTRRMALVQTPARLLQPRTRSSTTRSAATSSRCSTASICPGKDRHGAAYWCGSAALINREALLAIGGVATETIAEDFHTTIRLQRHGWRSRYHDEVLVQGLAPHDLDGYLLQRDRWARGNLAVFTLPESPLRARSLSPLQRPPTWPACSPTWRRRCGCCCCSRSAPCSGPGRCR